jgi:methionine-rich copper-binding protein CopC
MTRLAFLALALSLATATAVFPAIAEGVHFGLRSSTPAADATVASVDAIRLTFTQVPQENSATIRLVNAAGDLVETGAVQVAEDDPMTVSVAVDRPLANGRYTVAWRGMGDDGHVVRGEFGFTLTTQR